MNYRLVVFLLALLKIAILLFVIEDISISAAEAHEFFVHSGIAGNISFYTSKLLGVNDFGARAPFLTLHFLSILLFYELSTGVIVRYSGRILATTVFMFLPGVNFSAILINKAGAIIFLTLVLLFCLQKSYKIAVFGLLIVYSILDGAFSILFLALSFYAIKKDDKKLLIANILFFAINMYIFGFDSGGKPKGMFLDTFAVYMAIFSPIVFLYFVFALYKSFRLGLNQPAIYISFWALIFSLILSIRQKINFEDFAPFVVISVLFMVPIFFSSYRVRLRPFRRSYRALGYSLIASLAIFTLVPFGAKLLYPLFSNPKSNFAYSYHIAKELSCELKKRGILNATLDNKDMQERLKFYNIGYSAEYKISKKYEKSAQKVSIIYSGVEVATYYVTKVNTL